MPMLILRYPERWIRENGQDGVVMGAQTQMALPGSTGVMLPLSSREALGKHHNFSLMGLP